MLNEALEYLARGWSIIPIKPGGKLPMIEWRDYQTRQPTKAEVEGWWRKWPLANIAVITGRISGIVVVDIDLKAGGSLEGQDPSMLMANTPGGHHLYYSYPDIPDDQGVRNRAKGGVDIRADGGYAILSPSKREDGRSYTWAMQGAPAKLPEWVTAEQTAKEDGQQPNWLENTLLNGCEVGQRNDTVARLAGYLAGKDLPKEIGGAIITQWMAGQNNPLPPDEIETTVESVYRTERSKHPQLKKDKQNKVEKPFEFELVPYEQYMIEHGGWDQKWMLEGWLPDQTIGLIVAPPESYKTWIEFDMAVSIAGNLPFLDGLMPERHGPVILIQQEDFPGQIAERLALMQVVKEKRARVKKYKDKFVVDFPGQLPIFIHQENRLQFSNDRVMEALERQIEKIRPALTIIDPLYSAASTEDYMASSVQKMKPMKNWRTDYKTSFVLIHHTKKSTNTRSRERLWGSQFLNGFIEFGWQVHKITGPRTIIERHAKMASPQPSVLVTHNIDTSANWIYAPKVQELTSDEVEELLADYHASMDSKPGKKAPAVSLSPIAQKVLELLKNGPMTHTVLASTIGSPIGVTDVKTACDELDKLFHIKTVGKRSAMVKDAAALRGTPRKSN